VLGELLRTRSEVLAPATPLITIEDFQRPEEEEKEEKEDGVSGQGTNGILLEVDYPGISAMMGERGSGAVLGADAMDATDAVVGEAWRGTSGMPQMQLWGKLGEAPVGMERTAIGW
jgi:hypothetical protein